MSTLKKTLTTHSEHGWKRIPNPFKSIAATHELFNCPVDGATWFVHRDAWEHNDIDHPDPI